MKYDTIIIGGGLSGLVCGIRLQEEGQKCAIISAGQSALHFSSGSFDLLNKLPDGTEVVFPLTAMTQLSSQHPYSKIGVENVSRFAKEVPVWFKNSVGLELHGEVERNHYRISPIGIVKSAWMSFEEFTPVFDKDVLPKGKALILNFEGFLDFYPKFIAESLTERGVECRIKTINMPAIEKLRVNPTEMRSANIARVFESELQLEKFMQIINGLVEDGESLVLPSTFGLTSVKTIQYIKTHCRSFVYFVSPVPPSVPGIRTQKILQQRFIDLGGSFYLGDKVVETMFDGNKITGISSANHGDIHFHADSYILATGSFFSNGIIARSDEIYEPVLNADVDCADKRDDWFDKNVFNPQPYMEYGVKTDTQLHPLRSNVAVENMYVSGSVLSGYNPLEEGSGSGVAILSAFYVTEQILSKRKKQ